ncbi:hypothetical protein GCU72_02135 [Vibrio sp. B1Z05]|nr:hypothetical protein [Vibrio sp. B1Z05]
MNKLNTLSAQAFTHVSGRILNLTKHRNKVGLHSKHWLVYLEIHMAQLVEALFVFMLMVCIPISIVILFQRKNDKKAARRLSR